MFCVAWRSRDGKTVLAVRADYHFVSNELGRLGRGIYMSEP